MTFQRLRYLGVLVLLVVVVRWGKAVIAGQTSEKDGALIVDVTWGDINNTPANDVYAEAHGFVEKYHSLKSFILKMSHDGQYEVSLPPGVYDVFISEGNSVPRCRRLLVRPGLMSYWTLKLETDDVYTDKSSMSTPRSSK